MTSEAAGQMWRTSAVLRALGWLWVAASAAAAAATVVVALDPGAPLVGVLLIAFAITAQAWWWHRLFLRPYLLSTEDGVVIRNPFSSCVVAWEDVRRITPGYEGIEIARRQGPAAVAWAVQESNLASALGWRTRGRLVAQELAHQAGAVTGRDPAEYLPGLLER